MKITRTVETEATVQAQLYHLLTMKDVDLILEQTAPTGEKTKTGRPEKIRIDIAVLNEDSDLICCIEVKRSKDRKINKESRQYAKYQALGVPFMYCLGCDEIPKATRWVLNQLHQDSLNKAFEGRNYFR